jgi:type II secretory pathway component GspD/PulD (secretin)
LSVAIRGSHDPYPGPHIPDYRDQVGDAQTGAPRASDVVATVNALYGRPGALGERETPPDTLHQQLRQNLVPTSPAPPQAARGAVGRAATLQSKVTIVPDPGTNSLLIRTTRDDFELIQAAVQELDVRPVRVLIEVTIAELWRDRTLAFGMGSVLGETGVGRMGTTVDGSVEGPRLGDLIIRVITSAAGSLRRPQRFRSAR